MFCNKVFDSVRRIVYIGCRRNKQRGNKIKKFETGKTYRAIYFCNSDLYKDLEVIKRTNKNVWIKEEKGEVVRRKIHEGRDCENFSFDSGVYVSAK